MLKNRSNWFAGYQPLSGLFPIAIGLAGIVATAAANAAELTYGCSRPPLEAVFDVRGGYYSGVVDGGNLFLQPDIPSAPLIRWRAAKSDKLYTLMLIDLDGNAHGSYPDVVPAGANAPVRHWIVGNITGRILRGSGYGVSGATAAGARPKGPTVLQDYRSPHIPVVSDRYGFFLFEQPGQIGFEPLTGDVTNFNYQKFLDSYKLGQPKARNFFVAVYASDSPFSGRNFTGNDVSKIWHQGDEVGTLVPCR